MRDLTPYAYLALAALVASLLLMAQRGQREHHARAQARAHAAATARAAATMADAARRDHQLAHLARIDAMLGGR